MSVMSCDKYNMKIVFTIAHMNLGGAQRVCYNLINWIKENTDSDVHLIICSGRTVKEEYSAFHCIWWIVKKNSWNQTDA